METVKYVRKPFEVDAVQVTPENMESVAKWCQGEVQAEGEEGVSFIKVHVARAMNERQTKACVGDWVLYAGAGFKVYTSKAFGKSFEVATKIENFDGPLPTSNVIAGSKAQTSEDVYAVPTVTG